MQNRAIKLMVGLALAVGVALFFSQARASVESPRYTAKAEFSIKWNEFPLNEQDPDHQQFRHEFNSRLPEFKLNERFIRRVCRECGILDDQVPSITAQLRQQSKVKVTHPTKNFDTYWVEVKADDQDVALKAVNLLTTRFVNRINTKAQAVSGVQTFQSAQDYNKAEVNEGALNTELDNLTQQQKVQFSAERAARIQEINKELPKIREEHFKAGWGMFGNGVHIFVKPAEVVQVGSVQI